MKAKDLEKLEFVYSNLSLYIAINLSGLQQSACGCKSSRFSRTLRLYG